MGCLEDRRKRSKQSTNLFQQERDERTASLNASSTSLIFFDPHPILLTGRPLSPCVCHSCSTDGIYRKQVITFDNVSKGIDRQGKGNKKQGSRMGKKTTLESVCVNVLRGEGKTQLFWQKQREKNKGREREKRQGRGLSSILLLFPALPQMSQRKTERKVQLNDWMCEFCLSYRQL